MNELNKVCDVFDGSFWERDEFVIGEHEGYVDYKFGCRAGPEISIEYVCHEMAHAIHAVLKNQEWRIQEDNFSLYIQTWVEIGHHTVCEPVTMQATELECEVFGIQKHILESLDVPIDESYVESNAKVLLDWMPDWIFGGSNDEERLKCRMSLQ